MCSAPIHRHVRRVSIWLLCSAIFCPIGAAGAGPFFVGMGDSLGEGVQSADAAWQTQVFSYLNWINHQMGADLSLPLIQTNLFGLVGDTNGRSRIVPESINTNVAVSGATVNLLLNDRANATSVTGIDSETDLVLFPRIQSQISYVESAKPALIVCWVGNNDVVSAAIAFGNLDASQLTPIPKFQNDYRELVRRLGKLVTANGTRIVFANLPDITDISFLVDRITAETFLGFPVDLPKGHYTSIIGLILMKNAGNDDLVNDPDFVLDNFEVATIRDRILAFNAIIQNEAARIGMPVVDMYTVLKGMAANPPAYAGLQLSKGFLGGLFSLDGVHPSNIGHAILANVFIRTMNTEFGMNIPEIKQDVLNVLTLLEPALDKDKDGKVTGRPGIGLVETLAYLFGISGDPNDFIPN